MHHPALRVLLLLVVVALQQSGGRVIAQTGLSLAPSDELSTDVNHPLVPLATVATKVFQGEEIDEATGQRITMRVKETVLSRPKQIAGIEVTVVTVDDYHDGQLHDTTADYFAQGADGTVYYLGEQVDEFAHGRIVNHDGSWLSGKEGNQPGIFMPVDPGVGDTFVPEHLPDVAVQQSTVIAVDQAITTPAGVFRGCLVTKEVDLPLGTTEEKTYCPGVGLVREEFLGGYLELVAFGKTS